MITKLQGEITRAEVKQEVQGLQAFAIIVVTVNDGLAKPRFKRKIRG